MTDDLGIQFRNERWVKENKLCIVAAFIDMSQNFCITAKKDWVEKTCPELLTKYTEFLRYPDAESGTVYGKFGHKFLAYADDTIGIKWLDD